MSVSASIFITLPATDFIIERLQYRDSHIHLGSCSTVYVCVCSFVFRSFIRVTRKMTFQICVINKRNAVLVMARKYIANVIIDTKVIVCHRFLSEALELTTLQIIGVLSFARRILRPNRLNYSYLHFHCFCVDDFFRVFEMSRIQFGLISMKNAVARENVAPVHRIVRH